MKLEENFSLSEFKCKDGRMIMINDANVLMVEVFTEEQFKNIGDTDGH